MTILTKQIRYFGQPAVFACDQQCVKAWGIKRRPRLDNDMEGAYLPDDELGIAPDEVDTWEGEDTKPIDPLDRGNRWCVRQCERSVLLKPEEGLVLPDFSRNLGKREDDGDWRKWPSKADNPKGMR